jgi:hypothetical protein
MVYDISYADAAFKQSQDLHVKMARKKGRFDKVIAYSKDDLDEEFKENNKEILSMPRGGYWIWKSHIINMTLDKMKEGDYLLYSDAGAVINHSVYKLIKVMEKNNDDIMVFEVYGRKEITYTKRDVYTYFQYETGECINSNQIMATFILIKKDIRTEKIFKEYEEACVQPNLLLDGKNILGKDNFDQFQEHRHDQSILSVLLKKNGVKPYRDPSQFGLYQTIRYKQGLLNTQEEYEVCERSKFPLMMFFLHRRGSWQYDREIWRDYIKSYIKCLEYLRDKKKIV